MTLRCAAAIGFFLILTAGISAQNRLFEASAPGPEYLLADPGDTVSLVFLVASNHTQSIDFTSRLELPESWKLILHTEAFTLPARAEDVQLALISIPEGTLAKTYMVRYVVSPQDGSTRETSLVQFIMVRRNLELDLAVVQAPPYAIAGQQISIVASVTNRSNVDVLLDLSATSDLSYPVEILDYDGGDLRFPPQARRLLTIHVKTDDRIERAVQHSLRLTARVVGDSEDAQYVSVLEGTTEIFPKIRTSGDRFHRLPLTVELSQFNTVGPDWQGNANIYLSSQGALDEDGDHELDILLSKKSNLPPSQFADPSDVYRLSYANEFIKVTVGDAPYALTPLLPRPSDARGGSLSLFPGPMEVGGFYYTLPESEIFSQAAASFVNIAYRDADGSGDILFRTRLNAFSSFEESAILSIAQLVSPIPELHMEIEAAIDQEFAGGRSFALYLTGNGNHSRLSYHYDLILAEPEFSGFYRDMTLASGGLGFSLLDGALRLSTGFQRSEQNVRHDPLQATAPLSWSARVGSQGSFPGNDVRLSANWKYQSREDTMPDQAFHTSTNEWQFGLGRQFEKVSASTEMKIGLENDLLTNTSAFFHEHNPSLSVRPSDNFSLRVDATYTAAPVKSETTDRGLRWHTGINFGIRKMDIDFSTSNSYSFSGRALNSNALGASLNVAAPLGKHLELSVKGYYHLSTVPRVSHSGGVGATISSSFGIPVRLKKGIGAIRGTVVHESTGEPVKNVILRSGADAVVTDSKGRYSFPAVETGKRLLDVDTSQTGSFLQPLDGTPIEIEVVEGGSTLLSIEVAVRSAIEGSVVLYGFADSNDEFEPEDAERSESEQSEEQYAMGDGVQGVPVEISNDGETYRRVTNTLGRFSFQAIRPGQWLLKIYDRGIPEHHYVESNERLVVLEEGEAKRVEVRVLPKRRELKLIDERDLSL